LVQDDSLSIGKREKSGGFFLVSCVIITVKPIKKGNDRTNVREKESFSRFLKLILIEYEPEKKQQSLSSIVYQYRCLNIRSLDTSRHIFTPLFSP